MNPDCLYVHETSCIGISDFVSALKSLGVQRGDILFIHSDLAQFGKIGPAYSREVLCGNMLDAIRQCVGEEGTIAMPTYTFAFCGGKPYDVQESASETGAFTEFFRRMPGVVRSCHPIFSIASQGPATPALLDIDMDAFGPQSFLANLCTENVKILFLGVSFEKACTLVHHIEQLHKVPYRFLKSFTGLVRDGVQEEEQTCTFFVRPTDGTIVNDLHRLGTRVRAKKLLSEVPVGAGLLSLIKSNDVFSEGMNLLDEDIRGLLEQ
jgi:aminoglycoside 3-N-acetyltransferase